MTDTRFGELEGSSDLAATQQQHPHALPERAWPGRAAPFAVAALCLLVTAWSVREPGLTTDEPRYIENTERLHSWFGQLVDQGPSVAFQHQQLADGWYYARPDSKNLPLVSLVGSLGRLTVGRFDSEPASYRWGNLLILAVTCGVVFAWIREEISPPAAVVAVAALVGMPRVFTHAQLMSIDPLVASFQVLSCWALWKSRDHRGWTWPVLFGVLAGIGAMSKPTFWLIVPGWIIWAAFTGPRRLWRAGVCLVIVAPLSALFLMPPWWTNPLAGFLDYLDLLLNDPAGWKIDVYYLGHIFQTELTPGVAPIPVPWHSVPLLTAITTPPWILVLLVVEVIGWILALLLAVLTARADRATDHPVPDPSEDTASENRAIALQGLWLMAAAILPLIVMLPGTPAHDGTRLYRPAHYFVALLVAAGFERIRQRWLSDRRHWLTATSAASLAVLATWTTLAAQPAGLSYYNSFVGGFAGASRTVPLGPSLPEPRRPLHEISYWWELLNRRALDDMQQHLPQGARVTFFPEHYGGDLLQKWGHLRKDLQIVSTTEAEYMLMYGRMGRVVDPRAHPSGTRFLHGAPDWELRVDGVRVAVLVRVNRPQ
ncbi:MAG: hypothetical protein CMJ65_00265 [Planctomycetaceae bacterium]|nr:hypothetical protein [Planctomycetaceae bacterium]